MKEWLRSRAMEKMAGEAGMERQAIKSFIDAASRPIDKLKRVLDMRFYRDVPARYNPLKGAAGGALSGSGLGAERAVLTGGSAGAGGYAKHLKNIKDKEKFGSAKLASELTEESRDRIKTKNFALSAKQSDTGEPAYPIHDRRHAANALARVKQHGTPSEKAEVYKDVAKKYPELAARSDVPSVRRRAEKEGCGSSKMAAMRESLDYQKTAGVLHRIGQMARPGSELGGHTWEIGGLGILAAPSIDKLQAVARARLAGEQGEDAVERRRLLGDTAGEAIEAGGLGLLAVPSAIHLAKGLRGGH